MKILLFFYLQWEIRYLKSVVISEDEIVVQLKLA